MSVGLSAKDPKWDADINILGALNLLEAAVRSSVRLVLFASTGGAMYGEQDLLPTPETTFPAPVSPYGVAKLAVERYLHAYRAMHGLRSVVLRYANVYGPRQNPHGEAGVVAIFARAVLDGRPLTINGDGLQTRDYVYVADVVHANMRALETAEIGGQRSEVRKKQEPEGQRGPQITQITQIQGQEHGSENLCNLRNLRIEEGSPFNIGTGVEASVMDLVRHLEQIAGRRLEVRHGPPRAGEQRRSSLDPARAAHTLGWRPTTDLPIGLAQTFRWFAENSAH
jgi:UDP-glucose 4-epimerase